MKVHPIIQPDKGSPGIRRSSTDTGLSKHLHGLKDSVRFLLHHYVPYRTPFILPNLVAQTHGSQSHQNAAHHYHGESLELVGMSIIQLYSKVVSQW